MANSTENLKDAFAGESQANRRYLAFSRKAEQEGLAQIAKLFRAAAEAETVHALNHLNTLDEIKKWAIIGDAETAKRRISNYVEAGVSYFVFSLPYAPSCGDSLERVSRLVSEL
jgi:rubrerythrin